MILDDFTDKVDFFVCFKLLDELTTDRFLVQPGHRAARCTGVAVSVAAGLLGAYVAGTNARIVALVGGPCTEGPGAVKILPLCSDF